MQNDHAASTNACLPGLARVLHAPLVTCLHPTRAAHTLPIMPLAQAQGLPAICRPDAGTELGNLEWS